MLHPALLDALLDDEIVVINERLSSRGVTACRNGRSVEIRSATIGAERILRLDAERYDGDPVGVFVASATDGHLLPGSEWPTGLYQGEHPTLQRPFVCVRGTIDYHAHPSHVDDVWDRYRGRIRLVDITDHLLKRMSP